MINLMVGFFILLLVSTGIFVSLYYRRAEVLQAGAENIGYRGLAVSVPVLLCVIASIAYWQLGASDRLKSYLQLQQDQDFYVELEQRLQDPSRVKQAIFDLQAQLEQHPEQAEGWFLMGRIYQDIGRPDLAEKAFAKASDLLRIDGFE